MMVDALFGEGHTTAIKVVFAVIVVLVLLALAFWALRRFGGERLRGGATRGRQPRLAVIDSAAMDGRRRLVLIRRDNVEHLLIIGGPTDVVVEQNIVRAAPPPREAAPTRPAAATDALPRPVPLAEGSWPLQPDPPPRVEPMLRVEPRAEGAPRPPRPASTPDTPAEAELPAPSRERRGRSAAALAGLAEELSRATPAPEAGNTEQRQGLRHATRPQPAAALDAEPKASADPNLTEMAQRLEAALRRPPKSFDKNDEVRASEPAPKLAPEPAAEPSAPPSPARAAAPGEPTQQARGAALGDAKPGPRKSLYDDLENEMASLLGRPNSKP